MKQDRDHLDDLIDQGLSIYSAQQPRTGIERRVLEHVRQANAAPRRSRIWWFAIPALAAMVLLMVVNRENRPSPRPDVVAQAPAPRQPEVQPEPLRKAQSPVRKPRAIARRTRLPKQDEFPAPAPLSQEERALMALLNEHPEVFVEFARTGPITIDELEIEELPTGE